MSLGCDEDGTADLENAANAIDTVMAYLGAKAEAVNEVGDIPGALQTSKGIKYSKRTSLLESVARGVRFT